MIVVVSGEGPSDIGCCTVPASSCTAPDFSAGPMTWIIDQLIDRSHGFKPLEAAPQIYRYYSEAALAERAQERKRAGRFLFAGKKHGVETGYFYINSWMLAEMAMEVEAAEDDVSMAILFRDTDGTNSSPRDLWRKKFDSMVAGFERAGYERGVPMLPLPKSEAWLLCATKNSPYQDCGALESLPGNDASPQSAKSKLEASLGQAGSAHNLCTWLELNGFDDVAVADQMLSFGAFRDRALEVLDKI